MSTNDGGPAFPVGYDDDGGMSLRDYFAGQALAGLMSSAEPDQPDQPETLQAHEDRRLYAEAAYRVADAMLEAREQEGGS